MSCPHCRGTDRRALVAAIVAVIALLASGCSASPAGGSGGSTAGGSARPSAGGSGGPAAAGRRITPQKQLAYSECMRSHGVPGVPTSLPRIAPGSAPSSNGSHFKAVTVNGPNPGSPQWQAAQQACRSLMPVPAEVPG
jgi:hypothetical protein